VRFLLSRPHRCSFFLLPCDSLIQPSILRVQVAELLSGNDVPPRARTFGTRHAFRISRQGITPQIGAFDFGFGFRERAVEIAGSQLVIGFPHQSVECGEKLRRGGSRAGTGIALAHFVRRAAKGGMGSIFPKELRRSLQKAA
jgi:hypothetical protein